MLPYNLPKPKRTTIANILLTLFFLSILPLNQGLAQDTLASRPISTKTFRWLPNKKTDSSKQSMGSSWYDSLTNKLWFKGKPANYNLLVPDTTYYVTKWDTLFFAHFPTLTSGQYLTNNGTTVSWGAISSGGGGRLWSIYTSYGLRNTNDSTIRWRLPDSIGGIGVTSGLLRLTDSTFRIDTFKIATSTALLDTARQIRANFPTFSGVTGTGTVTKLAVWTGANSIGNSVITSGAGSTTIASGYLSLTAGNIDLQTGYNYRIGGFDIHPHTNFEPTLSKYTPTVACTTGTTNYLTMTGGTNSMLATTSFIIDTSKIATRIWATHGHPYEPTLSKTTPTAVCTTGTTSYINIADGTNAVLTTTTIKLDTSLVATRLWATHGHPYLTSFTETDPRLPAAGTNDGKYLQSNGSNAWTLSAEGVTATVYSETISGLGGSVGCSGGNITNFRITISYTRYTLTFTKGLLTNATSSSSSVSTDYACP